MRNFTAPTETFWNCTGIAIAVLSIGMSWSIIRAKGFDLEFAEYRLRNGHAINQVQQVSETLKQNTKRLPISKRQKQRLLNELNESNVILNQAEDEILADREEYTPTNDGL